MREFWRQARLPIIVVGTTLLAVATVIGVAYAVYFAARNGELMGRAFSGGAALAGVAGVVLLYFLPFAVALSRRHHNAAAIFIVNMFAGPIGLLMLSPGIAVGVWVGALAWSVAALATPVIARRAP